MIWSHHLSILLWGFTVLQAGACECLSQTGFSITWVTNPSYLIIFFKSYVCHSERACVCLVYVYVPDVDTPAHTCGGQKRPCRVFLFPSPPYPFETGSPQCQRHRNTWPQLVFPWVLVNPNSCCHVYGVSTPSHSAIFQPLRLFLHYLIY